MQGLCHLSRRWHQQFCRSPSFHGHQRCLQRWYHPSPLTLARQQPRTRPPPPPRKATAIRQGDLIVREYEQDDEDDPDSREPIDHDDDPSVQDMQSIRAQIQQLEEELKAMKQGPFGRDSAFMQSIPKDEREQLLKELEAEGVKFDSLEDADIKDDFPMDYKGQDLGLGSKFKEGDQDLAVTMKIPQKHKVWVAEFNSALLEARDKPDNARAHRLLWKWYLQCQQKVSGFSSFVNEDVWQFIWQSQVKAYPETKHIIMLAKDMMDAEVELNHVQHLDYVDALHATGDTASAIQEWEKEKASIADEAGDSDSYMAVANLDDELANRFWATGVRLYAAVGRPVKAEIIALKSLETRKFAAEDRLAFMVLVDVIRAWSKSKRDDADIKLWSCYLLMKRRCFELSEKRNLPTSILGQISSVLLNTGRRQMALAVFQDMLASHTGSRSASNATLTQHMSAGLSVTKGAAAIENDINQVGLVALLALPPRFKNKFFFGAWIKWLLGQDKVDDAALVVELMQEHGVKADAGHLNGIIGAWLRGGLPNARAKAEQMAWAMIHSRIDLVNSRNKSLPVFESLSTEIEPNADRQQLPVFLQRNMPPANLETFSVLLLRYTRTSDTAKASQLTDILTGPAELRPNCFILNHWLNLSLRSSDLNGLVTRYRSTREEIKPDLETFSILWAGCRRNLDRVSTARSPQYPTPRQLFSDMRTWYLTLSPADKQQAYTDFETDVYDQITLCFCHHSDLHGTHVALEQLSTIFGQLPHEDVANMILIQVARMLPAGTPMASKPQRPAIRRRNQAYRSTLSTLADILQVIMDDKGAALVEAAADEDLVAEELEQKDSPVQKACRLDALKTFICLVLRRLKMVKGPDSGSIAEEIRVAGKGMGVEVDVGEVVRRLQEAQGFERM